MAELEIPDAAVQLVADHCFGGEDISEDVAHDVALVALTDAAPLVVADKLRRLAARLIIRSEQMREEDGRGIRSSAMAEAVAVLRQQADELDPDGGA